MGPLVTRTVRWPFVGLACSSGLCGMLAGLGWAHHDKTLGWLALMMLVVLISDVRDLVVDLCARRCAANRSRSTTQEIKKP